MRGLEKHWHLDYATGIADAMGQAKFISMHVYI